MDEEKISIEERKRGNGGLFRKLEYSRIFENIQKLV